MSKYQELKDNVNRLQDIVLSFDKPQDDWDDRPRPAYVYEWEEANAKLDDSEQQRLDIAEGNLYRANAALLKFEQEAAALIDELATFERSSGMIASCCNRSDCVNCTYNNHCEDQRLREFVKRAKAL